MDPHLTSLKARDAERKRKVNALRRQAGDHSQLRDQLKDDYLYFSSFEFFMDPAQREATGAVYTPEWVVTLMVDRLLDAWVAQHGAAALWDARVLDPACGSGNFPDVLARQLVARLHDAFPSRSAHDVAKRVLTSVLHAWDINGEALSICRQRLKESWGIEPTCVHLKANTLLEDPEPYDLIVGNPPYGNLLDTATKKALGDTYGNIALNFIDWSLAHLKEDGECALIVPHSFTRVKSHYASWRRHMKKGLHVAGVIDVGNPFWDIKLEEVILFLNRKPNTTVWVENGKAPVPARRQVPVTEFYNAKFDDKMMLHWDPFYHAMHAAAAIYPFGGRRGQDVSKALLSPAPLPQSKWHILGKNIEKGRLCSIADYDRHILPHQMATRSRLVEPCLAITQFGTNLKAALLDPASHHPSGGVVLVSHPGVSQEEALAYLNHPATNHYLKKFVFNDADLTVHMDGIYLQEIPFVGLATLEELSSLLPMT